MAIDDPKKKKRRRLFKGRRKKKPQFYPSEKGTHLAFGIPPEKNGKKKSVEIKTKTSSTPSFQYKGEGKAGAEDWMGGERKKVGITVTKTASKPKKKTATIKTKNTRYKPQGFQYGKNKPAKGSITLRSRKR